MHQEEKPESEGHACEDKSFLILFSPEPVHGPFKLGLNINIHLDTTNGCKTPLIWVKV